LFVNEKRLGKPAHTRAGIASSDGLHPPTTSAMAQARRAIVIPLCIESFPCRKKKRRAGANAWPP
jgi:hypothetical protein